MGKVMDKEEALKKAKEINNDLRTYDGKRPLKKKYKKMKKDYERVFGLSEKDLKKRI